MVRRYLLCVVLLGSSLRRDGVWLDVDRDDADTGRGTCDGNSGTDATRRDGSGE